MSQTIKDLFTHKKVLVFGLGLQGGGEGDVRCLLGLGCELRITDHKERSELAATIAKLPQDLTYTLGRHDQADIEWADLILVNPGVPLGTKELVYAQKLGKELVSRTALFVKYCGIPVIGVTGTRGKSTTTELIYRLLDKAYPGKIIRGGNIPGVSDLELLSQTADKNYAVLELSSFQLEHFHKSRLSPNIAVVTNLYPDHLNRYATMAEYALAKSAICKYQQPRDTTLVNSDNVGVAQIVSDCPVKPIYFGIHDVPSGTFPHLPGQHNLENMAAVVKLGSVLGLSPNLATQVFVEYPGLPFRLESRGTIDQITYVNDTTSTTPVATIKAVAAVQGPIILILGGAEKSLPTDELFMILRDAEHVKAIVVLGGAGNRSLQTALMTTLQAKYRGSTSSMEEAVALAHSLADPGDTILLSPGFASFDLFQNEFDRGRQFNAVVAKLQT